MTGPVFEKWPSIARLNRDIQITEKIDGTNAAVLIERVDPLVSSDAAAPGWTAAVAIDGEFYLVAAQSRKRVITPGDDNFGFARWVMNNAIALVQALGEGRHFGEWWGSGIQSGYGLTNGEKRFSLFNVNRYADVDFSQLPNVALVPVLYDGPFSEWAIKHTIDALAFSGSCAAPGFMKPEGIVIFHKAAQTVFKVTIENDEVPKSLVKNG